MLTEICQYLKNWFNRKPDGSLYPTYSGEFEIASGALSGVRFEIGQYYRIMGSVLNDGVHRYPDDVLEDEKFTGVIWGMSIPPQVIQLAAEIEQWQAKYGLDALSPYQSESFGGYSYTKGSNATNGTDGGGVSWQTVFADRLRKWRKI